MKTTRWNMHRRRFLQTAGVATLAGMAGPLGISPAQAAGGTLRVSINRAPGKLNPLLHRLNSEYLLGELLYSGVTRLGPNMEALPDLAESWTANDTLTEWSFKLREGVAFHDGSALSVDDVVASLTAVLDKNTGSPGRRNLGPIESVSAGSGNTVVVKTSVPYGDLPVALTYSTAKIAPAAIVRDDLDRLSREAIGTGPFKLVSYEPDRLTVVEKNPNYFVSGAPKLDKVEVRVFPDAAAEMAALIAGEIDLALEVPPAEFERVSATPGVTGMRTASGRFIDVVMANDRPPFNDKRVREALALTLDRQAMIEIVAEGYGTPGNDTPINSAYRYYAEMPQRGPDIARAKALLAEAGYPDGIDLTLVASVKPGYRQTLAVVIREMAKQAGFNIDVQTMAHATYLEQVWKKGDFYVGFYNMQPTEDGVFKLLFTSDAAWNETRWNNAAFDNVVDEARTNASPDERAKLYAEAQRMMHEEMPALVPVFFDLLGARRDYVEGYDLHPRGAVFHLDKVSLGAGAPNRG
ncbi:MAG: ABC transporter substrate-binding protein [Kiloniellales bacterium]|nr:ABC transporter substrate-binding protein [Kiloniellales bacterium]